jgi:hypothetical protein
LNCRNGLNGAKRWNGWNDWNRLLLKIDRAIYTIFYCLTIGLRWPDSAQNEPADAGDRGIVQRAKYFFGLRLSGLGGTEAFNNDLT